MKINIFGAGLIGCFVCAVLLAFFSERIIKGEVHMKRLFGFIAIIIVAIVVCRGLVFAGDSTAVVKGSFNLATMLKNIDIVEILKWVGIVIAGLGGGGVTFWGVIIKIFLNAPNSVVAKIARSNGKWASKWLGQKVNATQEDKLEDTACVYMDNFKLGLKDN